MGCGCGGKKFSSGGAASRRAVASAPVQQPAQRVVYSPEVKKAGSPSGAVPLTKRTVV